MLFRWMSNKLPSMKRNMPTPAHIQARVTMLDSVNIITKKKSIAKTAMHSQVVMPRWTECAMVWPRDMDRYLS